MNIENKSKILPGFSLSVLFGGLIWFGSHYVIRIDPLLVAIVFGMIIRTLIGERRLLVPGLEWSPKILITPGIILYGANLSFNLDVVAPLIWLQIFVGVIVVVWLAKTFGNIFKLNRSLYLLLAVGTAICGASAIMIAKPVVNSENKDTATAVLVITIFGTAGMFLLIYLANLMHMDPFHSARMFATTLQQTSFVKIAASPLGDPYLSLAMAIKVARTATIIPLLLVVGTLYHFPALVEASANKEPFKVNVPWYLWGFILCGAMFAFLPSLGFIADYVRLLSSIVWTMAMFSIGLTVDIRAAIKTIFKPLLVGLIAWIGIVLVFIYTYLN